MRSNDTEVLVGFIVSKQYYESKPEEECGAVLHTDAPGSLACQLLQEDQAYVLVPPRCSA